MGQKLEFTDEEIKRRRLINLKYCLPYNRNLKFRAKYLRKNATKAERILWQNYLSKHRLRFYRQRPIDHYIADFYFSKEKLVIEIDGNHHLIASTVERDKFRTSILNKYGLTVMRFTNYDILNNFESCYRKIEEYVIKIIQIQHDHPPHFFC